MSELPDFKKIEFPDMPPIPLEDVVPDASPEVRHSSHLCLTGPNIIDKCTVHSGSKTFFL